MQLAIYAAIFPGIRNNCDDKRGNFDGGLIKIRSRRRGTHESYLKGQRRNLRYRSAGQARLQ